MHRYTLRSVLFATIVGLGFATAACKKEEQSSLETAEENTQDAYGARPSETAPGTPAEPQPAMDSGSQPVEPKADEAKTP